MSDTISLPSVLLFGVFIFFAIRYLFFSPRSSSSPSSAGSGSAGRRIDVSKVDQVSQMFPQLDRRAIAWDLSRNGGNVGATTERVLEGRDLEVPPPSFRPSNLNPPPAPSTTTSSRTATARAQKHPDLISRYNLSSKLKTDEDEFEEENQEKQKDKSWATTKTERATLFAKRREEMILAARRKMEVKQRREEKGKAKEVLE